MKICPKCRYRNPEELTACKKCGWLLPAMRKPDARQSAQAQTPQAPMSTQNKVIAGCAAAFFGVPLLFALLVWLGSSPTDPAQEERRMAVSMSHEFVERHLKCPSTAHYPTYEDADVPGECVVNKMEEGEYAVFSYVEAENSFGAPIRTHYNCTVRHSTGDTWVCEDIHLEE